MRQEQNGTTFLGRTSNTIYNLQAIPRNNDTATTIIIYQVNLNGDIGPQSTITLNW